MSESKIKDPAESAEFLWRSGLLYKINRDVLWPLGYALAVRADVDDQGQFTGGWEFAGIADIEAPTDIDVAPDVEAKLQRFLDSRGTK